VILPDATTSPRWEANDKPSLSKAFDDAGVSYDIQNAQGSVDTFGQLCDQMVAEVQVLMIVNIDQESGKACLDKATDAGVQSIDYDRLTPGGGASFYVSFDNVAVGGLMGTGLIAALDEAGKTKANIVYVNGAATDNNAALFKNGQDKALKDAIASGAVQVVHEDWADDWKPENAKRIMNAAITKHGRNIDAVLASNDGTAGGAIQALKEEGVTGKVIVTGQDAELVAVQRIVGGEQSMTIYKPVEELAKRAAETAVGLATGKTLIAKDEIDNGKRKVPTILLDVVTVTKDNVDATLVKDGFHTREAIYGKP
jgi:D-xylose transport system substrate-binding protein